MSATRGSQRSILANLGMVALGALLVLGTVAYSTLQFGVVTGSEFAPHSFQRREFHYLEIPLVELQITPIKHVDKTGDFEKYLAEEVLVLGEAVVDRWDLAKAHNGSEVAAVGDAQILCHYLDATDAEGKMRWFDWTKEHPQAARALWSAVARLAEHELYVLIPEVFLLAQQVRENEDLENALHDLLARRYAALAEMQQAMGRHAQAVELFEEALVHDPQHAPALEGSQVSRAALGQDAARTDATPNSPSPAQPSGAA